MSRKTSPQNALPNTLQNNAIFENRVVSDPGIAWR